jgi:CheY-like chemotaxis protein
VEARSVERDEARDSLREQQRLAALGRLAAGVGHEINNPLQYLMFHLEELRAALGTSASTATHQALAESLDGAQRIGRVVTSLRTYGVRQEQFQRLSLSDVIDAALRIAAPQVRHEATLRRSIGAVPDVLGDEGQLVQMLVNPLVNAAQALAGSKATVREVTVLATTNAAGWAEVLIADTGPGFDSSVLPRLGEPYVTTRARAGGTGLGLFVTRGLVSAHGGTLELTNTPSGGAQVRILLPPAPANTLHIPSGTEGPSPDITQERVLVVDDEPIMCSVMERVLRRMGHEVAVAQHGEEALSLLERTSFDIVISDLMMPTMSGAVFAERLATQHPALRQRLVIMTGGAVTEEDAAFLARTDIVVLNKPVSINELASALTRVRALHVS